jgi:hypothetical protein
MTVAGQRVVPVEIAEAPAEIDVLLAGDVLPAEKEHAVLKERPVNLAERLLAHWLRNIDAADFGAERIRKLPQLQCHFILSSR